MQKTQERCTTCKLIRYSQAQYQKKNRKVKPSSLQSCAQVLSMFGFMAHLNLVCGILQVGISCMQDQEPLEQYNVRGIFYAAYLIVFSVNLIQCLSRKKNQVVLARLGSAWLGLARHGSACLGSAWLSLAQLGFF